jgi:diketogulonate reductase-like aldo/keto reductase
MVSSLISREQSHTHFEIIYGTAWGYEETSNLVEQALKAGYRNFDTACQRPQYRQDLVGQALRSALEGASISRSDVWVCGLQIVD